MKKLTSLSFSTLAGALTLSLAGAVALTGGACGSSGSKTGTGGSTGAGGAGNSGLVPLTSSDTGFVQDAVSGVVGAWFAYGDSVGANANMTTTDAANSDCQLKGGFPATACTQITTPTPGQPFVPTDLATSQQCTSGIAALVMNKGGTPDYSDLWGGGIGLDFNNPGGDAGAAGVKDLSAYTGVSFDFSGDVVPPKAMRVNFPFTGEHGTDSPYWGGGGDGATAYSPLTGTTANPQHVVIKWADIGGPAYLTGQSPPVDPTKYPFNPQVVSAIQFQVFTNAMATTPYSFCVANLALTTN